MSRITRIPDELAKSLDLGALRREKIRAMIDAPAAQAARRLACTCRLLADAPETSPDSEEWEAAFARAWGQASDWLGETPTQGAVPSFEELPLSRRVTSTFDVAAVLDDGRPTREVPLVELDDDLDVELDDDADDLDFDAPTRLWSIASLADERAA